MSNKLCSALGASVLGATLVSGSLSANALTVGRCNALIDGVYVAVLVVKDGNSKSVHQTGSDGLTNSIVYNPDAALTWAVTNLGFSEDDAEYSDACHAEKESHETPPLPTPPVIIDEEEEEDDDDYGGEIDEVFF